MTTQILKSAAIANLDSTPVVPNTAGEGAPGYQRVVDAYVSPTQLALGDYYLLVRIPANAKIKSIVIATDKALDSNSSPTLALDFGVSFSDSTVDGTSAGNQGLVPTNAGTGATTTFASYTSPNILFGTYTPSSHTAAVSPTDLLFNGGTSHYDMTKLTNTPLWSLLGFSPEPSGFMDVYAYVSTAAATAVTTGTLYVRVTFCD